MQADRGCGGALGGSVGVVDADGVHGGGDAAVPDATLVAFEHGRNTAQVRGQTAKSKPGFAALCGAGGFGEQRKPAHTAEDDAGQIDHQIRRISIHRRPECVPQDGEGEHVDLPGDPQHHDVPARTGFDGELARTRHRTPEETELRRDDSDPGGISRQRLTERCCPTRRAFRLKGQSLVTGVQGNTTEDTQRATLSSSSLYLLRKVCPRRVVAMRATRPSADRQTAAIGEWAAANGFNVSTHGRIPAQVREAHKNRNTTPAAAPSAVTPAVDAEVKPRGRSRRKAAS